MHDPGHLLFRKALRVAIVLPLAYLFVMYVIKMPYGAPYTAFGTFVLLSFSDFGGPTADRARAYIVTGLVGLVAVTVGTFAALSPYAAVASTLVVGIGLTYAGVLRGYVTAATMSILLPFVIAVTAGPGLDQLVQRLVGFTVAIVFATAAALLLWPTHIRSALRQRVAETLDASANVVRAMWPPDGGDPSGIDLQTRQRELTEAHHRMREQYDGQPLRPGGATARDRALMQTIDELGRLRIILRSEPAPHRPAMLGDDELARCSASALTASADAIGRGGPAPESDALDQVRAEHRLEIEHWIRQQLDQGTSQRVRPMLDAGFHLRLAAVFAELIARHSRVAIGAPAERSSLSGIAGRIPESEPTPWNILRKHFTMKSPWLRNSLRSGLALAIAVLVVYLTDVDHGFWVVLGTLTALRLDAMGTGKTAVQAIVGTIGGFVVGTAVVLAFGDNPTMLWVLFPITVFLSGYTPGAISLPVGQASFTVFVIVFYGIVAGADVQTGEIRVIDVGIGLAISLFVSALMWPRGVITRMNETLTEAVHASTAYLITAYDRFVQGPVADRAVSQAASRADSAVSTAYETFDLSVAQGRSMTTYGPTWSFVANAAGHIASSADLILYLAQLGRVPAACPDAGDLLLACSHVVAANANSAVEQLAERISDSQAQEFCNTQAFSPDRFDQHNVAGLGDSFQRLEDRVDACLSYWETRPAELADQDLDRQALTLVWAEEWLIHLMWVSNRIREAFPKSEQPPSPALSGNGGATAE